MEDANKKKGNLNKILIGAAVIAVAAGAYYFATRPNSKDGYDDDVPEPEKATPPAPPAPRAPVRPPARSYNSGGSFPLRKGSRGTLVTALQEALMRKYGAGILPRFGADGDWGTETQNALIAKGMPTYLNRLKYETLLDKLNGKKVNTAPAPKPSKSSTSKNNITDVGRAKKIAGYFHYHIKKRDFKRISYLLSLMKTTADYSVVSEFFKIKDMADGTKRTLVSGLLRTFKDSYITGLISNHFRRMGLKKRSGKWSLSGFRETLYDQIKLIKDGVVWNAQLRSIRVPKDTILGEFISARNGVTQFKTLDGKMLRTSTENIRYV